MYHCEIVIFIFYGEIHSEANLSDLHKNNMERGKWHNQ